MSEASRVSPPASAVVPITTVSAVILDSIDEVMFKSPDIVEEALTKMASAWVGASDTVPLPAFNLPDSLIVAPAIEMAPLVELTVSS